MLLERALPFAIQRTGGVVGQCQDLFIGQARFAADRSIDVLSELAAVQRCNAAVEKRPQLAVDLALLDHYDRPLTDLELHLTRSAKVHDVNAFYRLRSVPGIGKILALVLLYEIHDIHRFPRGQDFVSYCRLVKCAKQSDMLSRGHAFDATKFFPSTAPRERPGPSAGRARLGEMTSRAAAGVLGSAGVDDPSGWGAPGADPSTGGAPLTVDERGSVMSPTRNN